MMEIDRISYIFGSFARRRQSREVNSVKRRSIEPTKAHKLLQERSKSVSHQTFSKTPSAPENKFNCPLCRKQFADPRVLSCLHTFCLSCLEQLEKKNAITWQDDEDEQEEAIKSNTVDSRKASSGGSGYMSDSPPSGQIICPTCRQRSEIPPGGVLAFPPNYPLQNRMVLATINNHTTHLLCDLCSSDVTASSRCMDCDLSLCDHCEQEHLRQKASAPHQILTLVEARQKGITRIRRQIMCVTHPDQELCSFCTVCIQVVCRDCISGIHKGHVCDSMSRAAKSHLTKLRLAVDRAKALMEQSASAATRLQSTSLKLESQCSKVQSEVDLFIENYIQSVQDHRNDLFQQIERVREHKLAMIDKHKIVLQKKIVDATDVANFLDELLRDGSSNVEILTFVKPVLRKIEQTESGGLMMDLKISDSLQFLPKEAVPCKNDFYTLYGVVSTQSVSPMNCCIRSEGLQNLRVGKKVEVVLETKDSHDTPLDRGGEFITAKIHHRDFEVSRSIPVKISDNRDGTYKISFVPDVVGKLSLLVFIKGKQIKDSPFPIMVRTLKPHHGTFHCCTFCSSSGSKEGICGCGGKMPGGYKGCGHGHEGHPGRRHWSCCGNVLEHSECARSNSHYQFTL